MVVSHNLFVDDDMSDEEIYDLAEEWCHKDPNGQNTGYSFSTDEITDLGKLKEAAMGEIKRLSGEIAVLNTR